IKVHDLTGDPFSFHLAWDSKNWVGDQVRWGNTLSGSVALRRTGDAAQWSGQLKAHDAQIAVWQSWIWPKLKEPVHGSLSGTFTLSGNSDAPQMQFSGKIHEGRWRSMAFENDITGTWTKTGLEPLVINGSL